MEGTKVATAKPWCQNIIGTYVSDLTDFYGAARENRTPDPRITNALLYQLSYCGAANERGGILTRGINRRKTGAVFCDAAQSPGQGENHMLSPPVQFLGDFATPLT